jgi:hypothetical protein
MKTRTLLATLSASVAIGPCAFGQSADWAEVVFEKSYAACHRLNQQDVAVGDRVKMNWSSPQPEVDGDFSGPVDPEVFVLSVQHGDGRPLSLLANYSLHLEKTK